jgi:UDP-N-acetylmuramoyl-tripeptide--D-alanyl-D-alanine ligase
MISLRHVLIALLPQDSQQSAINRIASQLVDTTLNDAATDSRLITPGGIFFATQGENTDGHQYITQAFAAGAMLAIVEKPCPPFNSFTLDNIQSLQQFPFCLQVPNSIEALQQIARYWRTQLDLKVIGITGSVGKSSTKELVASVLCQKYHTLKNRGNYNNEIGLPITLLDAGHGHEAAVLEMGFYVPGEITFLCDIAHPIVGIVSNIGTVHAERAGTQQEIVRGKTELVQALPPHGTAILNIDDPLGRGMAQKTKANIFFYGLDQKADLWADDIQSLGLEGLRFTFHFEGQSIPVHTPLVGRHNVYTALRAAAAGLAFDLSWDEILNGLQQADAQLRLSVMHLPNGALLLDDTYNAAPESTCAALDLLQDIPLSTPDSRRVAVLGEMYELGQYEVSGHQQVGAHAVGTCDILIGVGDRSKIITETALRSGMSAEKVHWLAEVSQAISFLREILTENDIVLVKGSHGLRMDRITRALEKEL